MTPAIAFAFVAGILTILAPCTLPVVPFVLGTSARGGPLRALGVVLGFGAAFVAVTVVLASVLAAAGLTTAALRGGGAIALALLGVAIAIPAIGLWLEKLLAPIARLGGRAPGDRSGLIGGLAIGGAIGLIWAPCVGPLMAAVIAVAVSSGPTTDAALVAGAYAAGAAIPLLVVAAWGRRATRRAGRPERRAQVQRLLGALMVISSLVVLTGADIPLENTISSLVPSDLTSLAVHVERLAGGGTDQASTAPALARPTSAADFPDLGLAPALVGISAWINSGPLTLASLRGKVVLVHFWTFDCINCIHVQPYVKAWYAQYAAQGFVVIGVHTPELSFERDLGNVRNAVAQDGVTFPVAFDPDFATWNAYHNSYWPALYFIDRTGHIRHVHFGEGDYAGSENVIQELLSE